MNFHEAQTAWQAHKSMLSARGVNLPDVISYIPDEFRYNLDLAMDAQPALNTTDPNSAVPAMLTTMIDPKVIKALFAPNKLAIIMGEERRGTFVNDTIMLPVTETGGEVSSYGDYAENGDATANVNWPQRQLYRFQIHKQYGDLEVEKAGVARINWISELDYAVALLLNKFSNLSYAYGINGLQNYGLFNDPNLPASITPTTKSWGGTGWYNASGQIAATANEIFMDIENLFAQLCGQQSAGLVDRETSMVLAMSPLSEAALTTTNSFNVNVSDLIKKNFPNLKVETAVQYQALSSTNTQGNPAGNFMQLIAKEVEGQQTGFCSFAEKMRAGRLIPATSSYKQKVSAATWGCILRMTLTIASMVGI